MEFDSDFYRDAYDFIVSDLKPLDHFIEIGWKDGLDPCAWFSTEAYLKDNVDVASIGVNPFLHYLLHGRQEGRKVTKSDATGLALPTLLGHQDSHGNTDTLATGGKRYVEEARALMESDAFNERKWRKWVASVPKAKGPHNFVKAFIDSIFVTRKGTGGFMVGWIIQHPESVVWFENAKGQPILLHNAFRHFRSDVYEAFAEEMAEAELDSGALIALKGVKPAEPLFVKAISGVGVHEVASKEASEISSDPKTIAEFLGSIEMPTADMQSRFTKVDLVLIGDMIREGQALLAKLPERVDSFGQQVESPIVSLIIPLYGRMDFVEGQMVAFVQDEFIQQRTEIIYVIDDPSLVVPSKKLCSDISKLYRVPFKVVWGGGNRGFSGANNLGAKHATGEYLLFMNSDVFPRTPRWLKPLVQALEENPQLGVVAPRLLFADGSIQHAGMEFQFRADLGVWINHHPLLGLDPELDPNQRLTTVPAVTGACMLVSRTDFDAVEGWDTGYLIGDFEDSDFCLKLREQGKECGYLPTVELTHLERQSFHLTGSPNFRNKVVILNATRHQNRWRQLIENSAN